MMLSDAVCTVGVDASWSGEFELMGAFRHWDAGEVAAEALCAKFKRPFIVRTMTGETFCRFDWQEKTVSGVVKS